MDSADLHTGESWPVGLVNVNSDRSPSVPRANTVGFHEYRQQYDGNHASQGQSLHDTSLRQSGFLAGQTQDGVPASTGDAATRNNDTIQTRPQRSEPAPVRGRGVAKGPRGFTGRGGRGSHRGGAGREVGPATQLSRNETTQARSRSDFGTTHSDTQHNELLHLTSGPGESNRGSPHVQRGGSPHRGHRGILHQRGNLNAARVTHAAGNESETRTSNEIVGQRGRGGIGGFQRGLPHRPDAPNARGGRVSRGGRGRGSLFREYDADFDRGEPKTAGSRSDKRLYHAPKNDGSAQAKQTERVAKAEVDDTVASAPVLSEYEEEEAVNLHDESSHHDAVPETGNRPGMIKTGIDVKAAPNQHKKDVEGKRFRQNDSRTPRHALNRSIPDSQSAACAGPGVREYDRSERDGPITAEALNQPHFTSSTAQPPQGSSTLLEAGHIRVESQEANSTRRENSTRRVNASPRSAERRSGSFSPKPAQRQLFNPSKDDPVRFPHAKANTSSATGGAADVQKNNTSDHITLPPFDALHISMPGYKPSQSMHAPLHNLDSSVSRSGDRLRSRHITQKYQELVKLETSVLDEDRLSQSSEVSRSISGVGDWASEDQKAAKGETYWVALIVLHRETAEAFQDLMEACVDIRCPATIRSIPETHDLAKRMWRSAFQLLFSRLMSALRGRDPPVDADTGAPEDHADVSSHFVDFVLYAYQFYTGILAQTNLSGFRDDWLEHLGDIASYRVMATKLLHEASGTASVAGEPKSGQSLDNLLDLSNVSQAETSSHHDKEVKILPPRKQQLPRKDRKKGFAGMKPAIDNDLEEPDTPGNSIGAAAINDWEVDEQDTWRLVAEEWYSLALANNASIGRLHHKLSMLTEDDDLRRFYHMVKSVIVSEPHSEAREDLAHFLSTVHNSSTGMDVDQQSALTTFLRLHAMLYLPTDLDNFDALLEKFELRLTDAFVYMKLRADRPRRSTRGRERDSAFEQLVSDPTWIMMAVINIASIMRYGQGLSPVQTVIQQFPHFNGSSGRPADSGAPRLDPTPAEAELADQLNGLNLHEQAVTKTPVKSDAGFNRRLHLACRMTFKLLKLAVEHSLKPEEPDSAVSPYITIIMTYLSSLAPNDPAISIILPEVPWQSLPSFHNKVPQYTRKESTDTAHLVGTALPEDWCIRGMAWSGRQLFARGCWNRDVGNVYLGANGGDSGTNIYFAPTSEKDVLAAKYESPSMPPHTGQHVETALHPAINKDDAYSEHDGTAGTERETLNQLRWKRLAFTAVRLTRTFSFLHMDGKSGAIKLDEPGLQQALVSEDNAALDEPIGSSLTLASTPEAPWSSNKGEVTGGHSNNRQARSSVDVGTSETPQSREQQRKRTANARISAVPGYTTIVCDTSPLLESLHVLTALVTSKSWTLIVPLAVIMMLDDTLVHIKEESKAPAQAIAFLEESIKAYSANVKVQTSRGNFLRDLAIRHEEIDFDNASRATGNTNGARNLNDVVINVALWQKEHWLDRRALLGLSTTQINSMASSNKREPSKLVFLTNDKNMRHKARAKAVDVWDAAALEEILNQQPNG